MEFWTVSLISLAAGLVIVVGSALVWYMGSLVKSAYQLKVDIAAEMEDGQRRIEENLDKKVRWIKRELVEEVEKMKAAAQADSQRRVAALADDLARRMTQAAEQWQGDSATLVKHIEALRHDVAVLDQRTRLLRRDAKAAAGEPAAEEAIGAAPSAAPAAGTPPTAAELAATAPAEAPQPAAQPG